MNPHHLNPHPSRRTVLATTVAVPAALALSVAGCDGPSGDGDRRLTFQALAVAEAELARLEAAQPLRSHAVWSWPQTLVHCAQSIEYAMVGYPAPKPEWFQRTLGAAAFSVFAWRGRMTHDLAEPIPGAPSLAGEVDAAAAMARLRASIAGFRAWTGVLRPHFAYGLLDKPAYEQAHAMHLANHLQQFSAAA